MAYTPCPPELLAHYQMLLGPDQVLKDPEQLQKYASDKSEDLIFPPSVVVKPRDTREVSAVLQAANEQRIPVYTRARGTGLAGSSLATRGGICLSMENFNSILEVDTQNLMLRTQPYVLNYSIQQSCQKHGLFYPPDPASYRICSIGGNVAMNASGPKAVKYGGTRNYVLGLELVLADGRILRTGARTLKNSSGYSLTQLLIGSEGTLAVITEITLRLLPLPKYESLVLLTFSSLEMACAAVHGILMAGITPCGLELMERKALQYAKDYGKVSFPPLSEGIEAHLLVELDGDDELRLREELRQIITLVQSQVVEIFPAEDEAQKKALWRLRRSVYSGIKAHNVIKEMDFCVPIARLAQMVGEMERIGAAHNFGCATYGHAGDGNLHVGIIPDDGPASEKGCDDQQREERIQEGIRQVFAYACSLGGVISGEHGIGLVQKPYLPLLCSETELELMRSTKQAFDPNHIMNPDKIFP